MSDLPLSFWDLLALWVLAFIAWELLLGAVRSIGKAWRDEQ